MIIKKVALGNSEEAFIEDSFSEGLNIIASDDNNKGKTIIIQSILYTIGNRPIFPSSFEYKKYYYYLEFMHNSDLYIVVRVGDSYIVKSGDGIRIFDGMSEFKRFWTNKIFPLPNIVVNGSLKIVDMELFVQLFFVGQDGKDTSTIFNPGFYHKEDFRNMLLSYSGDFSIEMNSDEIRKKKQKIKTLKNKRDEQLKLSDFYKSSATATEYLSHIKDQDAFHKRIEDMDEVTGKIAEVRKKRTHLATRKSLWNTTLKELRSLNRNIEVGELRCMDCNSSNITFKGKGKNTYSFDVSTPEMRSQIIFSIEEKIADINEEISRHDYEIAKLQIELQTLMDDDDVTIENIMAYKQGFHSVEEIEKTLVELDTEITQLSDGVKAGIKSSDESKEKREQFFSLFIVLMNTKKHIIDIEGTDDYEDVFTKRGTTISGSEETVFYVARLISTAEMIKHECPIIMDSFRAEDLSTDKEERVLTMFAELSNQCILTTTLKSEEVGKYSERSDINLIDYSNHMSFKLLSEAYVFEFKMLLETLHIDI